jgi:hypothetical protein
MTTKRAPSLLTIMTKAAKAGVAMRATLPDGTILQTLTGGEDIMPLSAMIANEAAEADKAIDVAFGKGVRKPQ